MEKIIENNCKLTKENLGIRVISYNYKTNQKNNELLNPNELSSIILTRPSTISTDIFKLNKNIQVSIFNHGAPTHIIIPIDSVPKVINNYIKIEKVSLWKKRKLAYIFCKGVCSGRIKNLSRLNEVRQNKKVKELIESMRELDRKLITCKTRDELMGYEGNIAKQYYAALHELSGNFFERRDVKSSDLSNILMNLYHTILRNKITLRLNAHNIPLNMGFLHGKADRDQPYLVWDFAELWIPYMDKLVFYTIDRGILSKEDILENNRLKSSAVTKAINLINKRIDLQKIDKKIKDFMNYIDGKGRFNWA